MTLVDLNCRGHTIFVLCFCGRDGRLFGKHPQKKHMYTVRGHGSRGNQEHDGMLVRKKLVFELEGSILYNLHLYTLHFFGLFH